MVTLHRIQFDGIKHLFIQCFTPNSFEVAKPFFNVFGTLVDDMWELDFGAEELVDGVHQKGEDADAQEFDEHLEAEFFSGVTFEITVAYCGEGCDDPVNCSDV